MPLLNTPRIAAAFALAAKVHENQKRKGTAIPYISHPMVVASQVLVWGGTEDQFIAALLHDVLEDGGVEYAETIEADFGPNVLRIVKALSAADKWHNLSSIRDDQLNIGDEVFKRFVSSAPLLEEKKRLTLWYYSEVVRIYRERGVAGADALERILREVEGDSNPKLQA